MDKTSVVAEIKQLCSEASQLIKCVTEMYHAELVDYYDERQDELQEFVHLWSERLPHLSNKLWAHCWRSEDLDYRACEVSLGTSYSALEQLRKKRHEIYVSVQKALVNETGEERPTPEEAKKMTEYFAETEEGEYVYLLSIVSQGDVIFSYRLGLEQYLEQRDFCDLRRLARMHDRAHMILRRLDAIVSNVGA